MPHINILPKSVADLIAAGEVVERPASAMKELIENAIDAGATKITVEIQNGGVRYMRVTDDGCGIAPEDVPKAFISHATSKIAVAEDLDAILTLGFRGEALASIAAVARVEMLTKTRDADFGTRYVIEGGRETIADPAGCPDGTTVVVRDLFYNTPARMKFLKRDATEGSYVSDVVTKIALVHPEISFRLIRDGRQTLFTSGDGRSASVLSALFGSEFREGMIPCSCSMDGITAEGYVSLPRRCRPTRNSQYFFVNSRCVKIPMGAAALDNAYKNSAMVGKFPACVINITVPAGTVDVNVHPAKTEVRFSDEKRIYNAIYYAAKSAIEEKDYRPALTLDAILDTGAPLTGEQTQMDLRSGPAAAAEPEKKAMRDVGEVPFNERLMPPKRNVTVYEPGDGSFGVAASPDAPKNDPPEKNTTAEPDDIPLPQSPDETADPPVFTPSRGVNIDIEYDEPDEPSGAPEIPAAGTPEPVQGGEERKQIAETPGAEIPCAPADGDGTKTAPAAQAVPETPYFVYLGEIFQTYLLAQYEGKLIIVDKHALHERILFNEIRARGACTAPQAMLLPVSVQLDRREYAAVIDNLDAFEKLGFSVSDFGDGTVLVREVPMMFMQDDVASVISELAGELLNHAKELVTDRLDWLYHSASCRAAVKGGSDISKEDAILLIGRVLTDDSLRYCPHGRPVLIELSKKELEKQFGRIQ